MSAARSPALELRRRSSCSEDPPFIPVTSEREHAQQLGRVKEKNSSKKKKNGGLDGDTEMTSLHMIRLLISDPGEPSLH